MNIIFVHGNFPGQFRGIASRLASNPANNVFFLTKSDNPQKIEIPNVRLVDFALHRNSTVNGHHYLKAAEQSILEGQAVLRALMALADEGFNPELVILHGGIGYGLFVKELFPDCKIISYLEWFFHSKNSSYFFKEYPVDLKLKMSIRSLAIEHESQLVDHIVCPTQWQSSQIPIRYHSKLSVIFDGIDTRFFSPDKINHDQLPLLDELRQAVPFFDLKKKIVSYGTRGMEPLRGFPEFFDMAMSLQRMDPDIHILIFGEDRISYSYKSPHKTGSWKQMMLEKYADTIDFSRLHFTGSLTYGQLRSVFQLTDMHCYFTQPYVISWGLFQAAACGASLALNRFPGVEEVFADLTQPLFMSSSDPDQNADVLLRKLHQNPSRRCEPLCLHSNLKMGLDLETSLSRWNNLIQEIIIS